MVFLYDNSVSLKQFLSDWRPEFRNNLKNTLKVYGELLHDIMGFYWKIDFTYLPRHGKISKWDCRPKLSRKNFQIVTRPSVNALHSISCKALLPIFNRFLCIFFPGHGGNWKEWQVFVYCKLQRILFKTNHSTLQSTSMKQLGFTLDSGLNWVDYIKHLSHQLARSICFLRQLKLCLCYESLLTSLLFIVSIAHKLWYLTLGQLIHSVKNFKLQKRAVRILAGAVFDEHCQLHFIKLKILTLPSLDILHSILDIHRNINQ